MHSSSCVCFLGCALSPLQKPAAEEPQAAAPAEEPAAQPEPEPEQQKMDVEAAEEEGKWSRGALLCWLAGWLAGRAAGVGTDVRTGKRCLQLPLPARYPACLPACRWFGGGGAGCGRGAGRRRGRALRTSARGRGGRWASSGHFRGGLVQSRLEDVCSARAALHAGLVPPPLPSPVPCCHACSCGAPGSRGRR